MDIIIILNSLKKILSILATIMFVIIMLEFVNKIKEKSQNCSNSNITENNKTKVTSIVTCIKLVILEFISMYVLIKYRNLWLVIIINLPIYLRMVASTCSFIETVKNVVTINNKKRLSFYEKFSLMMLAMLVLNLDNLNFFKKLSSMIQNYDNPVLSDLLVMVIYVTWIFLYIFFICALCSNIILFIINKIVQINVKESKFLNHIKILLNKMESYISEHMSDIWILFRWLEYIKTKESMLKLIGFLLIPVIILGDLCIYFFYMLILVLSTCGEYVLLLVNYFIMKIYKILNNLYQLSDKRIIFVLFRISLIFSLVIVVIVSRYEPFFKRTDASISILEFIASSIIIPIIFDWIYSSKNV